MKYLPQPEAVHNTAWWPEVKDTYEAFVREHPRKPLPDTLTWETRSHRGHQPRALAGDRQACAEAAAEPAPLPDLNEFDSAPVAQFRHPRSTGARVTSVVAGSNADSFGVEPGDVIMRINGRVDAAGVGRRRSAVDLTIRARR